MKTTRRAALAGLAAIAAAPAARASTHWPIRQPIRWIATFPPGGTADTISRILTPRIGAALGQTVVVENRPGAGGTLGADIAAKAAPDGYTLVMSHAAPHGIAPGIYPKLPYDPVGDFSHIALVGHTPNLLMVPGDSPIRTLADYVAAARAQPGELAFGSSGVGANTHLMGELFASLIGVRLKHVPYRGSAPALQDLLAGAIPSMFDPITTNVSQLRAGKLRALALSSPARLPAFPDLPTFAELGYPRMTTSTWVGLSGPKGLAPEIVQRLHAEVVKASADPEVRARFAEVVLLQPDPPPSPAEYTRFIAEFATTWTAVSKAADVVVE